MDIVVINLDVQAQCWHDTQQRFASLGLEARRMPAVDGRLLTPHDSRRLHDPALNRRQHHKPLRPGEIGCYASHQAAWRQLLDSGAAMAAVFEDDIDPSPELPRVLDALGRSALQWDLVKLFGRDAEKIRERRPLLPGSDFVAYRRVPSHTCAYVVSRRGARKLLDSRVPFGRPVDVDIRHWWENDLQVLGVQPYPVRVAERGQASAIDEGRRGCSGIAMRMHKLLLQCRYTILNRVYAGRRQRPLGAPLAAALHGTPRDAT